ncbi:MAG: glycosyl hydrolase family 8 [Fibrobacteria bacterium]
MAFLPFFLISLFPEARAFGPTASLLPRIADTRLDSALARTARGLIKHNIDPYPDGLVHRPNSEEPGDAVSEGQAYGMIVALYSGDQATFNRVWDAAETALWSGSGKLYNWRLGADGGVIGSGMATDADQDIALMLLFADSLASKGVWKAHSSPKAATYRQRALEIIGSIWNSAVQDGRYLAPGSGWGGKAFVNPGYFSPASYRIFAKADPGHDWMGVIDQCYATLFANPGAGKGLLPDWMVPDGSYFEGSLGYNAFRGGRSMYKDAIRVHWRLAMDWLWFGDARAKRWLDSAAAFIRSPERANFYTMDGVALPATDTFSLGNGEKRSRREYSELTVGMWACAAFSSLGPEASRPWADAMVAFLPTDAGIWGLPADLAIPERTGSTPNEEYFEQFLAWFGAAVMAGRFSNIWDDLDDPLPGVPVSWTALPAYTPADLDFQVAPLHIEGRLNKPAGWTARITHYPSNASWSFSQRSADVTLDWKGMDASGMPFPQGWCAVTVSVPGLPEAGGWAWLSHHRDLRVDGSWLMVDDFSGPALQPNLGTWGSFANGSAGGTAKVGPLAPSGTDADRALTWSFDLGTGGYQYCGLEWRKGGWSGMAAMTKIRYRARATQRTVIDLHLLQSDITDDNYFGALDTIGTAWKTYEHGLADFQGRLGNRSGKADAAKGQAFRWHIQADKNPSLATGSVTVDDIRVTGDLAAMYTAPFPALPRSGVPPASLRPGTRRPEAKRQSRIFQRKGRIEFKTAPFSSVAWLSLDGKQLGTSRADADGLARWTLPPGLTGLLLARERNLAGLRQPETRSLLISAF